MIELKIKREDTDNYYVDLPLKLIGKVQPRKVILQGIRFEF